MDVSPCFMELNMSFKIKIKNNRGDWYQLFPDNEVPSSFIRIMKKQNATFYEDGSFECNVYEIQPIIDCMEEYIKEKEREFNSSIALRGRLSKRKEEMNKGVYKVVPNSIFDLTNEYVPYTRNYKTGYDLYPTWRIIELNAMTWPMFMSYNFIKFIESSIYRADELSFKLKENRSLLVKCYVE